MSDVNGRIEKINVKISKVNNLSSRSSMDRMCGFDPFDVGSNPTESTKYLICNRVQVYKE